MHPDQHHRRRQIGTDLGGYQAAPLKLHEATRDAERRRPERVRAPQVLPGGPLRRPPNSRRRTHAGAAGRLPTHRARARSATAVQYDPSGVREPAAPPADMTSEQIQKARGQWQTLLQEARQCHTAAHMQDEQLVASVHAAAAALARTLGVVRMNAATCRALHAVAMACAGLGYNQQQATLRAGAGSGAVKWKTLTAWLRSAAPGASSHCRPQQSTDAGPSGQAPPGHHAYGHPPDDSGIDWSPVPDHNHEEAADALLGMAAHAHPAAPPQGAPPRRRI